MSTPRVLLIGGHGKISLLLTPLLLARAWHVTSIIRNPDHESDILKLANGQKGKLDVLVRSLEDTKSASDARKVIDEVKPDYIVWSAGAGGKGGASRTFAVDRDAAKAYIEAGVSTPSVKKFLLISYIGSRRDRPSWWTDEDWASSQKVNNEVLANYFKAKVDADEFFVASAEKRRKTGDTAFQYIELRPGILTDDPATGKVLLGKTPARGNIPRGDVAAVAAELLARDDTRGYYDLLEGDADVKTAVDQVVKDKWNSLDGEDLDRINALVS